MKNLIIVGAGGCGREVLQWAKDSNRAEKRWNIKGFLDDNAQALEGKKCDVQVIGSIKTYKPEKDDEFICAVGSPEMRKKIVQTIREQGGSFVNLIHPTAVVADTAQLGGGIVIYPYAVVSDHAVIQDYCIVNMHSAVTHDTCLGEYSTISAFCDITGNCRVGKRCFLGTGVKLVPGTVVGDEAFLCAGSVVMTKVRNGAKMMGNPAKCVRI